jgi:16S rRNA (guanine527-N7)-methyltransferase
VFHVKPENQSIDQLCRSLINADRQTTENLIKYLSLIKLWSKKMNLVSISDRNDIFRKHFIPSFWFNENIKDEKIENILDIGSGSGFPGLILKILNPKTEVYLIESNRKKTLFLKEVSEQLDIFPVIINDRMENFNQQTDIKFDIIVSRAVTSINVLWEWSVDVLKNNGAVYIIKGQDYDNELIQSHDTNFKIFKIKPDNTWVNNSPNLKNKIIIKMVKV